MAPFVRYALISGAVLACAILAYNIGSVAQKNSATTFVSDLGQNNVPIRKFMMTTDPALRLETFREIKASYTAATTSLDKARTLNVLVGMVHSAHEPYLFDELFAGEPFERFLDTKNAERSLINLSEYSYALSPTSYAAQTIAYWDTVQIRLLTAKKRTTAIQRELDAHVASILRQYDIANKAIGQDLLTAKSEGEIALMLIRFYQWQGHLLGDIALVDPQYRDRALSYINKAIMLAERARQYNSNPVFTSSLATVHYGYARYASGDEHADTKYPEIKDHLAALADILKNQKEPVSNFYIQFASVRDMQMHGTMPAMDGPGESLHEQLLAAQAKDVKEMAKQSPELRELLASLGLMFDQ